MASTAQAERRGLYSASSLGLGVESLLFEDDSRHRFATSVAALFGATLASDLGVGVAGRWVNSEHDQLFVGPSLHHWLSPYFRVGTEVGASLLFVGDDVEFAYALGGSAGVVVWDTPKRSLLLNLEVTVGYHDGAQLVTPTMGVGFVHW